MVEASDDPKVKADMEAADDDNIQVDFSKKKKKKKKKAKDPSGGAAQTGPAKPEVTGFNWNIEGHKEYEYSDLLDRIEAIMNEKSANTGEDPDVKGELPQTKFVSVKTSIVNFDVLCQQLDRDPDHVLNFFKSEMDVEGNKGSEGNVLLQGRHKGPMINSLYKRYVENYVRCLGCKSIKTEMTKDAATRLLNLRCKQCDATRTCQNIKKGFHAIRKGERKKER